MTLVGWAVLAATIVIGVVDWVSVAARVKWLEYATKPAFMLGLIALAVALQPASSAERAFFIVALALGLLSDVFLMLPTDMFLAGLGAALVEHLAYIAGFRARDLHMGFLFAAAVIALLSVAAFLPPIVRSLRQRHPRLVAPVIGYVVVFVVMVASAGGTGSVVALTGALLFFYSDALLAWNRFVKPLRWGRVTNIVPYHAGEAVLVLSLLQ